MEGTPITKHTHLWGKSLTMAHYSCLYSLKHTQRKVLQCTPYLIVINIS